MRSWISRFLGTSVLFASAIWLAGAQRSSALETQTAATLLAKHRTFVGWTPGDGTLTSWKATYERFARPKDGETPSPASEPSEIFVQTRRGVVFRDTATRGDDGAIQTDSGFTGRLFWSTNVDGFPVTEYDDSARSDMAYNAIMDETISSLPATSRGTAQIDGATYDVARVTVPNGFPVDLYVGSDGAYRRAIINPDDRWGRQTYEIEAYVDALPGKKIIGTFGSRSTHLVLKHVDANPTIADADLVPPKPRAHWDFKSSDPIPVQVVSHPQVFGDSAGRAVLFRASIDGHEGTFLLDSGDGAGITLFNPYAADIGLKPIGSGGYVGVNGNSVGADYAKVSEVKIGGNVLHDAIVERSHGSSFSGVDGIMGFDILAQALVDVDVAGGSMTILDPMKFGPTVEKGAVAFPVDLSDFTPAIHIMIGSNVDAKVTFDTGNDFSVALSDELRSSGKITSLSSQIQLANGQRFDEVVYVGGVDGTATEPAPCIRITHISVGPIPYENSPVCFGSPKAFGANGGLIGFDFLRHFNWTFDYPEGKLILTPNSLK
jgi:hypothetical protein